MTYQQNPWERPVEYDPPAPETPEAAPDEPVEGELLPVQGTIEEPAAVSTEAPVDAELVPPPVLPDVDTAATEDALLDTATAEGMAPAEDGWADAPADEPVEAQPAVAWAGADTPSGGPRATEPWVEEPAATESSAETPAETQPAAAESAEHGPWVEAAAETQPAAAESAEHGPWAEAATETQPAAAEPTENEPSAEVVAESEPANEEDAEEPPGPDGFSDETVTYAASEEPGGHPSGMDAESAEQVLAMEAEAPLPPDPGADHGAEPGSDEGLGDEGSAADAAGDESAEEDHVEPDGYPVAPAPDSAAGGQAEDEGYDRESTPVPLDLGQEAPAAPAGTDFAVAGQSPTEPPAPPSQQAAAPFSLDLPPAPTMELPAVEVPAAPVAPVPPASFPGAATYQPTSAGPYGQPTPSGSYGQTSPPYGQPTPPSPYGQPTPSGAYGQAGSPYGQPTPSSPYGQTPAYGAAQSPYRAAAGSQPSYGQPEGGYGQAGGSYGQQPSGLQEPTGQQPGYQSQQSPYGQAGPSSRPYADPTSAAQYQQPSFGQQQSAPLVPYGQQGYGQYGGYAQGQSQLSPSDETTWAAMAHWLGIPLSFIGPLIALLVQGDKSPRVRAAAVESLNFQLTLLIGYVASLVLSIVLIGAVGFLVLPILQIVFPIIAAVAENKGQAYQYPFNIRMVK